MYDASNRRDIRKAEKEARQAEISRLDYLKAAMAVPQGRAWFHDFLEACHLFSDPFTGDPLREAYTKGERNVGLLIYSDIVQHCPDDFVQMMKEANVRRIERNIRNSRNSDRNSATEHTGSEDGGWDAGEPGDDTTLFDSIYSGGTN